MKPPNHRDARRPEETTALREPQPARILVVEDDSTWREFHTTALKGLGYTIATAQDGSEALSRLSNDEFDLVITDRNMAEVSGVELIRKIRADGNSIPIMMVSRSVKDEGLPEDVASQILVALPKPTHAEDVRSAVAFALRFPKFTT